MTSAELTDDLPVDPDDELLVAYLDGELERAERQQLEQRLLDEAPLRTRMQQLQRGWDLLSEMDAPLPHHKLVESTLELAVADILRPTMAQRGRRLYRSRWPLGILAACVLAAATIYGVSALVEAAKFRRQLKDLAIAEHLDAYLHGADLTLMRQLAADQAWVQTIEAVQQVNGESNAASSADTSLSAIPISARQTIIANLPLEKRAELMSRWERFKRLNEDLRSAVRVTADTVARQDDQAELLRTMRAYSIWRETIQPPELRDQITASDPTVRQRAIAQAIEQTQRQIAERSSYMLDEETVERIYVLLRSFVRQRVRSGDERTKRAFAALGANPEIKDAVGKALELTVLRADSLGEYRPEPLTEPELKWIRFLLTTKDLEKLEEIAGGFQPMETMTLRIWAAEAVRRRYRSPRNATTLQRYQSLDPTEREVLDLLPPQRILEELSK
jgi:hypothetical protein